MCQQCNEFQTLSPTLNNFWKSWVLNRNWTLGKWHIWKLTPQKSIDFCKAPWEFWQWEKWESENVRMWESMPHNHRTDLDAILIYQNWTMKFAASTPGKFFYNITLIKHKIYNFLALLIFDVAHWPIHKA